MIKNKQEEFCRLVKEEGISIREICSKAKVSAQTFWRVRNGMHIFSSKTGKYNVGVTRLSKYFGVDPSYFLSTDVLRARDAVMVRRYMYDTATYKPTHRDKQIAEYLNRVLLYMLDNHIYHDSVRTAIKLKYGLDGDLPMTFEEIGKELHVSKQHARHLLRFGISTLQKTYNVRRILSMTQDINYRRRAKVKTSNPARIDYLYNGSYVNE